MSDLVNRLSKGKHPVSATRYDAPDEFKAAIERGFVLVKFTETKGGTELGFAIDREQSTTEVDDSTGQVKLVGPLTLDYVPVDCSVEIDIETLTGTGRLIVKKADKSTSKGPKTGSTESKKRKSARA